MESVALPRSAEKTSGFMAGQMQFGEPVLGCHRFQIEQWMFVNQTPFDAVFRR